MGRRRGRSHVGLRSELCCLVSWLGQCGHHKHNAQQVQLKLMHDFTCGQFQMATKAPMHRLFR